MLSQSTMAIVAFHGGIKTRLPVALRKLSLTKPTNTVEDGAAASVVRTSASTASTLFPSSISLHCHGTSAKTFDKVDFGLRTRAASPFILPGSRTTRTGTSQRERKRRYLEGHTLMYIYSAEVEVKASQAITEALACPPRAM